MQDDVKTLHDFLKKQGFLSPNEVSDGLFGRDTESAVKRFQKSKGLLVDGLVGENVEAYLSYKKLVSSVDLDMIVATIPESLKPYARKSITLILQECDANGVSDRGQIAYILATAEHESHLGQWMIEFVLRLGL